MDNENQIIKQFEEYCNNIGSLIIDNFYSKHNSFDTNQGEYKISKLKKAFEVINFEKVQNLYEFFSPNGINIDCRMKVRQNIYYPVNQENASTEKTFEIQFTNVHIKFDFNTKSFILLDKDKIIQFTRIDSWY